MVAFWAPAGRVWAEESGARRREVEVVKGRRRRERKLGMLVVIARRKMKMASRRARGVSVRGSLYCFLGGGSGLCVDMWVACW